VRYEHHLSIKKSKAIPVTGRGGPWVFALRYEQHLHKQISYPPNRPLGPIKVKKKKSKAIPVTGRGGLYACKMLRIGSQMAVRLSALRTGFTPQKHYFYACDTHFCCRLSKPQGLVRPEGLGNLIKIIHLIGSRTRDLPVCNIAP
jgi:hypothetical protein